MGLPISSGLGRTLTGRAKVATRSQVVSICRKVGRCCERMSTSWREGCCRSLTRMERVLQMLCAEVSLYPQKTTTASEIIAKSIESLDSTKLECKVGSISTHIHGSHDDVWQGLRTLFDTAKVSGEVNMVVTLSNSAD
jgi:uncharacterized protein YqgV (UPF0045/DUF77 family)